ncbi:MAG: hypothetical protein V2A69_16005 [Pseudomonadota bacterium]
MILLQLNNEIFRSAEIEERAIPTEAERLSGFYFIKNKDKQKTAFRPNLVQQEIVKTIEKLRAQEKPVRIIILKPRQVGCTTFFGVRFFDKVYWNPNQFMAIIAHQSDMAHTIFDEIIKFVHKNLPPEYYRKAYHDSVNQLAWQDNFSQLKVTTDAHGITPNLLHLTEVARYENAQETIGEALPGVPRSGEVVQESTANGSGGYFFDACQEAINNPEGIWTFIFLRWWIHEEYTLPVPRGFQETEQELELLQTVPGLTRGNLVFRREKIEEMHGDRIDVETGLSGVMLFQQNYPFNPQEAFIVKNSSLFDTIALHDMLMTLKPPLSIQQQGRGYLRVFKNLEDEKYLISCDPSYGEAGDYSAVTVFKQKTREIVATLHGKYVPRELAKHLVRLGKFYDNALLAIERNTGHAVLNEIINHIDYVNIYYHTEYDERHNKCAKAGFPTTAITRNQILPALEDAIASRQILIPDEHYIHECIHFGHKNGKWQATEGHDDRVMSLAIGNYLCMQSEQSLKPPVMSLKPTGL